MGKVTFSTDSCKGCGLCVEACPKHLIQIAKSKINLKGHHPAEMTNMDECVGCGACAIMCPDCVIKVER